MLNDTQNRGKCVKTIAVASGKGGVGKTNIVASLAIAMRKLGKRVVIVDADLGLSNIAILLNKQSKYTIKHLLAGTAALKDILIEGPHGIQILPAGEGLQDLTHLDEFQQAQASRRL
jgi:flagellar biosynthesis protein FlhG